MDKKYISNGSILEGMDLEDERRIRKLEKIEKTVGIEVSIEGWKDLRLYKNKKRIFKEKDISEKLEDKVWLLFYDIGINKISSKNFSLLLRESNGIKKTKQIDVLALDNNIVFIIECKTKEELGKKSLKKEIAEFALIKSTIHSAIKGYLQNRELKFIDIYITENILWDKNDEIDAKENNILVWDEYDLLALEELVEVAGKGAKYQIFNRIFYDQEIRGFDIKVPAIKAKMGGYTYYVFSMKPEDLLKISYVHRRQQKSDLIDLANTYQRMIKQSRIRQIELFIKNGGFFPGSIILNFHRKIEKEEIIGGKRHLDSLCQSSKPVSIKIPHYYGSAWIIDGQHRLYGYANLDQKTTETVPVVAFVDLDDEQKKIGKRYSLETKLFVDVNKNQKSIESNLLWDLYEDLYVESEYEKEKQLYVISKIAKLLNNRKESPFFRQIAIPKEQNTGNITLTAICVSINQQRLIHRSDELLFSKSYDETIIYAFERISEFFRVIKEKMHDEWNKGEDHYIKTNAGVFVLMGILRDIVECNIAKVEKDNIIQFAQQIKIIIDPLINYLSHADKNKIDDFRGAGGAGQKSRQVRYELTKIVRDSSMGFRSRWLELYEKSIINEKENKIDHNLEKYLSSEEEENLEFKGSISINFDRFFLYDGVLEDDKKLANEGILKTIVAFLNTKGGTVVIGVLEKNRYVNADQDKLSQFIIYGNKILVGINIEYGKDKWDGYYQRLLNLICDRISPEIIDMDLIDIKRVNFEKREFCIIRIKESQAKQYLEEQYFYVRRGNKTDELKGPEIDRFWRSKNIGK